MESHSTQSKLVPFIRKFYIVTTSELAFHFKISWNTAEKYLLELTLQNKITRIKKQGVNLWTLNSKPKPTPRKTQNKFLNYIIKNKVVTTSELASYFKISWNTAEKYLLELTLQNKITRIKKQGVNLWILK